MLLIDERPEEVTEMQRTVKGEVVASTFDEPARAHVQVAEMVIEKAKRLVEHKRDVIVLLDSITSLARAYNTVVPSSGKVLTGDVDANALHRPKRFFGAARNVEEGGCLTIIATALSTPGRTWTTLSTRSSKVPATARSISTADLRERIFPAFNINRSARAAADHLDQDQLAKIWILRKLLHPMDELAAVEFLIDKMKDTKTNSDFFELDEARGSAGPCAPTPGRPGDGAAIRRAGAYAVKPERGTVPVRRWSRQSPTSNSRARRTRTILGLFHALYGSDCRPSQPAWSKRPTSVAPPLRFSRAKMPARPGHRGPALRRHDPAARALARMKKRGDYRPLVERAASGAGRSRCSSCSPWAVRMCCR